MLTKRPSVNKKVPAWETASSMCGPTGMSWTSLGPFQNLRVLWQEMSHPVPGKSPRRGGARWGVLAAPGRAVSRGASGPGGRRSISAHAFHGSGGEEERHAVSRSPRWGVGVPRLGGRAVTARPSLASPPPGFLRRPRPPCCCGAEAAPAESPAAVTGCATGSLRPAWRLTRRRRPRHGRVFPELGRAHAPVSRSARGRAGTCARRQVGEAARRRGRGARGRCGRRRPRGSTGRAEGAARRAPPGSVLGSACGPRPRPRPRTAVPGGNLRPRGSCLRRGAGGPLLSEAGKPGPLAAASLGRWRPPPIAGGDRVPGFP
jgi:hypothetical protein